MTEFNWSEFARVTKDREHWPILEEAARLAGGPGDALDLGCGAGRDTRYLLSQGWRVTAVDREPSALALLADLPRDRLRPVQSSFEDFDFEPLAYDLVSAQFTLPFVPRSEFGEVFARVKAAVKPGGVLTGQFFGVRDEWNTPENDMTFVTREEAEGFLDGLAVVEMREEEGMGSTALGGTKYWHVFHFIAKK